MNIELKPTDLQAARVLGSHLGVSTTLAQLLLQRELGQPEPAKEFLDARLSGLTSPAAMADRDVAADRLARAVRAREKVCVFGDYDVDGATSASIMGEILEHLGAEVEVLVANRFEGGYGFSSPALQRAFDTGATLIVTCDFGSSDHERIATAMAKGIDVIVVDHHLVPEEKLPALAFLNPHRPECGYPYKGLCSAGLALSVGAAVRASLGADLDLRQWLDLVALGTIADVAPLDGDNRRLVRAGLKRLSAPRARPGVVALREIAKLRAGVAVGAIDVAFRLAPRLNAPGRLGDPSLTVALLRSQSLQEARGLAAEIEVINQRRRDVQNRISEEAIAQVEETYGESIEGGIVVSADRWHRGVVGIVAARLTERFNAPAIVISVEDGVGHGSCRTVGELSIHRAVSMAREHLLTFGGHDAAAGLSLKAENLEAFRADFDDACRKMRHGQPVGPAAHKADLKLDGDFPLPTIAELASLEPVGAANPQPRFLLEDVRVLSAREVGQGHLKLGLEMGGRRLSAFGWDLGHRAAELGARASLIGALAADTYKGGDAIEMKIEVLL